MASSTKSHKVAFFLSGQEGGGLAVETKLLCKNLDRNYFKVVGIFCSPGPYFKEADLGLDQLVLTDIGLPRQMQIIEGDKWRHSKWAMIKNLGWFTRAVIKLSNFLKKNNVELVHSNGGYLNLIADIAAKKAGAKSIWHLRGLFSQDVPMRIYGGPLGAIISLCTDQFVGISRSVVDSMPALWKKKAVLVYDGIDFDELDAKSDDTWLRNQLGIEKDRPVIGTVGLVVPIKGHRDFIEMVNIVHKNLPEALFIVIGSPVKASADYAEQMHDLVNLYGLGDCFRWMGDVAGASRYLGGLDILVSATVPPGEGFGLTMVEAMGQGVPVVATCCGAGPELVPDGKAGFIVAANSPEKLAEAILKLLGNKNLCKQMGEYGRKWSRKTFDIKITTDKVEQLYLKLLD